MRWAVAVGLFVVGVATYPAQAPKDDSPTRRYGVEADLKSFPQGTPKETLASVLKARKFDVIFFGKQAIDSDAFQVPTMVSHLLGLPRVNVCTSFEVDGAKAAGLGLRHEEVAGLADVPGILALVGRAPLSQEGHPGQPGHRHGVLAVGPLPVAGPLVLRAGQPVEALVDGRLVLAWDLSVGRGRQEKAARRSSENQQASHGVVPPE